MEESPVERRSVRSPVRRGGWPGLLPGLTDQRDEEQDQQEPHLTAD